MFALCFIAIALNYFSFLAFKFSNKELLHKSHLDMQCRERDECYSCRKFKFTFFVCQVRLSRAHLHTQKFLKLKVNDFFWSEMKSPAWMQSIREGEELARWMIGDASFLMNVFYMSKRERENIQYLIKIIAREESLPTSNNKESFSFWTCRLSSFHLYMVSNNDS